MEGVSQNAEKQKIPQAQSEKIKVGIEKLEKVVELFEQLEIDTEEMSGIYRNALKIQYLRDLDHAKSDQEAALVDLKKKLSSLSKLEILKKVPKNERFVTKPIIDTVREIMSREGLVTQK